MPWNKDQWDYRWNWYNRDRVKRRQIFRIVTGEEEKRIQLRYELRFGLKQRRHTPAHISSLAHTHTPCVSLLIALEKVICPLKLIQSNNMCHACRVLCSVHCVPRRRRLRWSKEWQNRRREKFDATLFLLFCSSSSLRRPPLVSAWSLARTRCYYFVIIKAFVLPNDRSFRPCSMFHSIHRCRFVPHIYM